MSESENKNLIVELTFQFALKIIEFVGTLERHHKYIIARQVMKSGTSIGANVREAQNAESRADFIHKLKIAAKEADETTYWLLLCKNSKGYDINNNCDDLLGFCNSISKVLSKIIVSAKQNGRKINCDTSSH